MGCTTLWFSLSLLLQMTARYAIQGGSFTTLKTDIEDHAKRLPRLSNKQMANSLYLNLDNNYGMQHGLFFDVLVWDTGLFSAYLTDGYSGGVLTNECNQPDASDDCFESGGSFKFEIAARAGFDLIDRDVMVFFFPQTELPVPPGFETVSQSLDFDLQTCLTVQAQTVQQRGPTLNLSAAAECMLVRFRDAWNKDLRGVAIAPFRASLVSTAYPDIGASRKHGGLFTGRVVPVISSGVQPYYLLPEGAVLLVTVLPPMPWSP